MLTLEECRQHLPEQFGCSDEELEAIREQLYELARQAVQQAASEATDVLPSSASFVELTKGLPVEERDAIEERAAVREYDGYQSRKEAELGAVEDLLRSRRRAE